MRDSQVGETRPQLLSVTRPGDAGRAFYWNYFEIENEDDDDYEGRFPAH